MEKVGFAVHLSYRAECHPFPHNKGFLGHKPGFLNWVEMCTPTASPDLSFSVSKGVALRGMEVTGFLNSQKQGWDDAGRGGVRPSWLYGGWGGIDYHVSWMTL